MADRIKGITIKLDGDATGLDKALKGVNNEIKDTEKELKDVNRLLKIDPSNTELLTQKQKLLTKEIGDTENKLKTLQNAAKDAKKALDTGEISQKQYDALQREIIETENKLKGLKSEAKSTSKELITHGTAIKETAEKVGKYAKAVGAAIGVVGAATVAASKKFYDFSKDVAERGNEIDKMSQKLGLSTEAYQRWDYVLSQADVDINSMQTGLKTLTNKLDDAKNGGTAAQGMFQKLGISMQDINSMSREQIFEATIKGFQGMADSTERAALANDLFGKSGQNLTPLFNETAESTEALLEKAEKYGMVMSQDAVNASAAFMDSLDTLSKTAEGLKNRLMAEFLPALTEVTDGLALIFTGDMGGLENIEKGINDLITKLSDNAPKIFEVASSIVTGLATAIINNLPTLLTAAVDLVMKLAEYIIDNLPLILKTAMTIVITIAQGIIQALPDLIPALVDVILEMVDYLTSPETMEMLINVGVELIIAVGIGLMRALPKLLVKLPDIIGNIALSFINLIPMLIDSIKNSLGNNMSKIVEAAKGWGKDMLDGIVQGILNNITRVANAAKQVANKIKSFLHFSRPDEGPLRDYQKWMPDFVDGLAKSLENSAGTLQSAVKGMATEMSVNMTAPNGISSMLGQYLPYLANRQQIVLDTGVLVGETAPMYNRAFGQIARKDALI